MSACECMGEGRCYYCQAHDVVVYDSLSSKRKRAAQIVPVHLVFRESRPRLKDSCALCDGNILPDMVWRGRNGAELWAHRVCAEALSARRDDDG